MKKHCTSRTLIMVVICVMVMLAIAPPTVFAKISGQAGPVISQEILVKLKPGKQLSQVKTLSGARSLRVNRKSGVITLEVPQGVDSRSVLQQYSADSNVEYAEPNYLRRASYLPNDPELSRQWYIDKTRTKEAWGISTGASTVKIAIIDSGLDINHPDFAGKVAACYNAADNTSNVTDNIGHGTHVAGIAAAAIDNGTGIAGIGGNISIIAVKASNTDAFFDDDIAEGIYWATDHGARIINLSLGGEGFSNTLEAAINYALNHNVVVVAAAGNDGTNVPSYPAAFPGVIAVAASDNNDLDAAFSNYGTYIDISAPGVDIFSTTPLAGGTTFSPNYDYADGTSMASPAVAGLAGLVISCQPNLTQAEVGDLILQNAQDLRTPGWDELTGWGRIDAYATLQDASDITPPSIVTTVPADTESNVSISQSITLNFSELIGIGPNYGNITVKDAGNQPVQCNVTINNSSIIIDPVNLLALGTAYTVTIPAGTVQDARDNALAAAYSFTFTTANVLDFLELPFSVTDAAFDPTQPVVYITNKTEKKLYQVNYQTGATSALTFAKMPESLAIGQGTYANELYVALLDQDHNSYWMDPDLTGSIAVIDRTSFTQIDTINLTTDPYDLVAGRDGYLYITSGSGQWTKFSSYNRATKQLGQKATIRQQSFALLHPTLDRIYTVPTNTSPRDYYAYNIANGQFTDPLYPGGYDSPYHGDYSLGSKFSIDPSGQYLFNGSGVIFTTTADRSQDMRYVTTLERGFYDIAFAPDGSKIFAQTNNQLYVYDGTDFSLLDNYQLEGAGRYLAYRDGKLINLIEPNIYNPTATYQTGIQILNAPTTETNPPTVSSSEPVSNDQNIGVYRNLLINFNERIAVGANYGQISLRDSSANLIPITTSIEGRTLTIDPVGILAINTEYTLSVPAGAVVDLAGNGLADVFTLNFATSATLNLLELPFTITDAVYDPVEPVLYITDKSQKQLYKVNYQTGATSALTFAKMPERLAFGQGAYANELYVTLLDQEHSSYWYDGNLSGAIAVIDRNTFTQTDTITLTTDPYDLVVGRDGYLYITSGSGQWTKLSSYNRASKQLGQQATIRQSSFAELHPTLDRIYTVTTDSSPRDYHAYNIANGQFTDPLYPGGYDSPYHGDYALNTNFTITPSGKYLLNGSGVVFGTEAERSQDMLYVSNLAPFKAIAFDQDSAAFYTITNNNYVNVYSSVNDSVYLTDFQMIDSHALWEAGKFIFKQDNQLIVLFEPTTKTTAYQSGIQLITVVDQVTQPEEKIAVVSTDPIQNASNVPINKVITVTFNDSVQAAAAYNNISLSSSSGSVSVTRNLTANRLSLTPTHSLAYQTMYTVTIPGGAVTGFVYSDLAAQYTFSFTTENVPGTSGGGEEDSGGDGGGGSGEEPQANIAVVSTDPVLNATNVTINKVIAVTFNDALQAAAGYNSISLSTSNGTVPVTRSLTANQLSLTPTASLAYQTAYTVTIPAGAVTGYVYNDLAAQYTFSFTTENAPAIPGGGLVGGAGGAVGGGVVAGDEPTDIDLAKATKIENTQLDGQSAINLTLDSPQALAGIKGSGRESTVVIPITQTASVNTVVLNNEVLNAILGKNDSILIKTPKGSYLLPSAELNATELAKQLGVLQANLALKITITEPNAAKLAEIAAAIQAIGYQEVAVPLEFTVTAFVGNKQAEISSFGRYVSRELVLNPGVNPVNAIGVVINPDGSFTPVPTIFRTENGKTIAVLKRKTNSTYTVIQNSKSFADLTKHWAQTDINSLASKLIIMGTAENTFNPEGKVTRAEIVAMLVRGLGLTPQAEQANFKDISAEQWYAGAVGAAVQAGLIQGYPDGTFRPNQAVTRQEVALLILKALKSAGIQGALTETETANYLASFSDGAKIEAWAKTAVAESVKAGVVKGNAQKQFAPLANSTRAECAVMLKRMLIKAGLMQA